MIARYELHGFIHCMPIVSDQLATAFYSVENNPKFTAIVTSETIRKISAQLLHLECEIKKLKEKEGYQMAKAKVAKKKIAKKSVDKKKK